MSVSMTTERGTVALESGEAWLRAGVEGGFDAGLGRAVLEQPAVTTASTATRATRRLRHGDEFRITAKPFL
jgi:hypothetical protein